MHASMTGLSCRYGIIIYRTRLPIVVSVNSVSCMVELVYGGVQLKAAAFSPLF